MEETVKILVELFAEEYKEIKRELESERKLTISLSDQNKSLFDSTERQAQNFKRLAALITPAVKWEKDEAICLNSFDKKVIEEICDILYIGEKYKPSNIIARSLKKGTLTSSEGA